MKLAQNGLHQHHLKTPVDRLLNNPARRTRSDKGRNQQVCICRESQAERLGGPMLVDQRLHILGAQPELLCLVPTISLNRRETFKLDLAT